MPVMRRAGQRPTVLIIGAGALGRSLAALLADKAFVTVYDRNAPASRTMKKGWFILREKGRTRKVEIRAIASLAELKSSKVDVLIFATKIMGLRRAVAEAAGLDPRYVLFPQNGIFETDWTKRAFKKAKICRAVTTMACQANGQHEARLFYKGDFYIGGDGADVLAGLFRQCGAKAKAYEDPSGAVWAKLIFSAVMNPLPVITAKGYDVLKKDREAWALVRQAIGEGRKTARALKVKLAFDPMKLIRRVRDGDLAGITHQGSIAQDLGAGRATELDLITGALIRQARRVNIKTPSLDTIFRRARAAGA